MMSEPLLIREQMSWASDARCEARSGGGDGPYPCCGELGRRPRDTKATHTRPIFQDAQLSDAIGTLEQTEGQVVANGAAAMMAYASFGGSSGKALRCSLVTENATRLRFVIE